MGCPLPKVSGTLSAATKLAWDDLDQTVSKLLHLDVTPANSSGFGSAWTEVDSGTNVNVSSGVLTIVGNAAYATNGMYLTAGLAIAAGYIEFKTQFTGTGTIGAQIGFKSTAALDTALATGYHLNTSANQRAYKETAIAGSLPGVVSTYYTIRFYIGPGGDGTARANLKITITGGIYTVETILADMQLTTALASTFYPGIQRNAATGLTYAKEFAVYSGYTTDGSSTTEFVHDAGAGKKFNNLDFTVFAMPASMSSTNLKFAYYFADAPAAYSAFYTLAELNALGKITGDYRYIGIKVQSNSDGDTQVYAAKPNSDTAIDGIGDFPGVADVRAAATVQGAPGTLANLAATDGAYVTLENSRNNDNGTVAADIATGKSVKIRSVTTNGAAAADPAPSAPVIIAAVYGAGKVRVKITTASDYDVTYTYYRDGSPIAAGTEILDTVFDDTGVTAASHIYKVRANGVTGNTFSNEVTVNAVLTPAEDDIWTAVKAVFAADTGIVTITSVKYNQVEAVTLTTGQTSLQLFPLAVDRNTTKPTLILMAHLRTYRTSSYDSAESDLMTISRRFNECVATISTEETWLTVEYADDTDPLPGETQPDPDRDASNLGYAEMYYTIKVSQV